jgi:hypothetical protein
VGLIDDLLKRLLRPIIDRIKRWLGPFGKLLDKIIEGYAHLLTFLDRSKQLLELVVAEVVAWKHFKENIAFRTKVINLVIARRKTEEFINAFSDAWNAIRDLFKDIQRTVKGAPEPEELAGDVAKAIEDPEGVEGLARLFPKLAKLGEKLLGAVVIFVQGLEGASDAVDDLLIIARQLQALRLEIEELDTVFLSQKNRRKVVTLNDGSKMRIRIGNLH